MDYILSAIVVLQLISGTIEQAAFSDYGAIPEKCQPRAEMMYRHCCIFPPFFTFVSARECGAHFSRQFVLQGTNITGLRRIVDQNCDHWQCILDKYHLLNKNGQLNDDRFFVHLDKWVDLNPPFAQIMLNAKINCKLLFRTAFPLDVCEFFDFLQCLRNYVTVHCPVVLQTPKCLEQEAFYKDCKQYFI